MDTGATVTPSSPSDPRIPDSEYYGGLVFSGALISIVIGRAVQIIRAGTHSDFQLYWLFMLFAMFAVLILDGIIGYVPGFNQSISRCILGVIFGVAVVTFSLCQSELLFKTMPLPVRVLSTTTITTIQCILSLGFLVQIAVAAAAYPPWDVYLPQLITGQDIWLGLIALFDMTQTLLLFRFIVKIRCVAFELKLWFFSLICACLAFVAIGLWVQPGWTADGTMPRYTLTVIGDDCVCAFGLASVFCLEAAAACHAASKPTSLGDSTIDSDERSPREKPAASERVTQRAETTVGEQSGFKLVGPMRQQMHPMANQTVGTNVPMRIAFVHQADDFDPDAIIALADSSISSSNMSREPSMQQRNDTARSTARLIQRPDPDVIEPVRMSEASLGSNQSERSSNKTVAASSPSFISIASKSTL